MRQPSATGCCSQLNGLTVQRFKAITFFGFVAFELLKLLNVEPSLAQTPFYQGKTIRIIVGYQPGDNHDQWARTYARFMGKHIPGQPEFVAQNMPGAGAMIAANHVYNVTKPDGLTLGAIGGALIIAQITGRKEVQFDWAKFTWIGTPDVGGHLLYVRSDSPFKTVDDLRHASEPAKCSATGVGSTGYDLPRLLQDAFGFKFSVVSGYPGGAEQDLAMERGEVNCRAITIEGFFGREPFLTWYKNGFVRILLQTEKKRNHRITGVPTVYELMDRYKVPEDKRRLVSTYLGLWGFGSRPIVSTPDVTPDRVKILRNAWTSMFKDPEFNDELKKRKWEADPVDGVELESLAKEIVNQPPDVTAALKRILSKD
jgi:tripartite-type tricarboxylate transporter receptor subunit TctC